MGMNYLVISGVCTISSVIALRCWTETLLEKFRSDGLISENTLYSGNMTAVIYLLLRSHVTVALLALCVIDVFALLILSLKTLFFGELYSSETRKLVERLVNYVIYKGIFVALIVPPTIFQAGLWVTWLTILCCLKMFQGIARDRLERLNACPSATPWTYFRVYSALLLVLAVDFFWLCFCVATYGTSGSTRLWLFLFEPLSIAFETSQAIMVHGFQLLDIWVRHSSLDAADCHGSKLIDTATSGSLWEWRSNLVWNLGFFLDMMTLLMALGHYALIWWLHGMSFQLVDAFLLLHIRALVCAMVNLVRGFIKFKRALGTLHKALPDATFDEIQSYDDECAICREPMVKAKKLPCNHLFHLVCLRSWLDQGLSGMYSCPTCRKPVLIGRNVDQTSVHMPVSRDEQLARRLSAGLDNTGHVGLPPNQNRNSLAADPVRGSGPHSNWFPSWPGQDGASSSTGAARSLRLGRVQTMMRHLASMGEAYTQATLEDSSWGLWSMNPSQATTSETPGPPPNTPLAYRGNSGVVGVRRRRTLSQPMTDSITNLLAMAETVREVVPHIPDEIIFQDLQRTNSVSVTVNNLLQM